MGWPKITCGGISQLLTLGRASLTLCHQAKLLSVFLCLIDVAERRSPDSIGVNTTRKAVLSSYIKSWCRTVGLDFRILVKGCTIADFVAGLPLNGEKTWHLSGIRSNLETPYRYRAFTNARSAIHLTRQT